MKSRLMVVSVALAVAWGFGCGKDDPGATPAPSGADEAPAELVAAQITVEESAGIPEVTVDLKLPKGWAQHEFFEDRWVPKGVPNPMDVYVTASASCGGACDAAQIAAQIADEMKEALETVRAGYPGMGDHFKGTAEALETGEQPAGRFLQVYRTTYPEAPKGEAQPIAGTFVKCYLHRPGDDFYVLVEAHAKAAHASKVWPALEGLCAEASYTVTAVAP